MKNKKTILLIAGFLIVIQLSADIAPNPIAAKRISGDKECKVQMVSEYVLANLYKDSARVECTFYMHNLGDSVTMQIGFPEMRFHYWHRSGYGNNDKEKFKIFVNDSLLSTDDIRVPKEFEDIYNKYMHVYFIEKEYVRKKDSILKYVIPREERSTAFKNLREWRQSEPYLCLDMEREFNDQMEKGNFPWYVWDTHFEKNEKKIIRVDYTLPSGLWYRAKFRYFHYILETGAGWFGVIENADIKLKLHNIEIENIEKISPKGYHIDSIKKTIEWNFKRISPTRDDDIYFQYFDPEEREKMKQYQIERQKKIKRYNKRQKIYRIINPFRWFK
jgi:hypothetical protein